MKKTKVKTGTKTEKHLTQKLRCKKAKKQTKKKPHTGKTCEAG